MNGTKRVVCTIAATNYYPRVEVLFQSLKKFHPELRFYALTLGGAPDHEFPILDLSQLQGHFPDVPLKYMLFQYDLIEAATALKPFLIQFLIDTLNCDEVVFLDPDILLFAPMGDIWPSEVGADLSLTPHLLYMDTADNSLVSEKATLKSGIFNLGFMAVRKSDPSFKLLKWWQDRLRRHCLIDLKEGLFTDQKWMDLSLGFMDNIRILRDPGLNVAHWNIHERGLDKTESQYTVRGSPLRFFHFSGFSILHPQTLSRHRNDTATGSNHIITELLYIYRLLLLEQGEEEYLEREYVFEKWENGIPIPQIMRDFTKNLDLSSSFSNPFDSEGAHSFFRWMLIEDGKKLPPLLNALWINRLDLQKDFKHPEHDKRSIIKWFVETGINENCFDHRLSAALLQNLQQNGSESPSPN